MNSAFFFRLTSYAWLILSLYWFITAVNTKMTVKKQTGSSRLGYLLLMAMAFMLVFGSFTSIGLLGKKIIPQTTPILYIGLFTNLAGIMFAILARGWLGSNWSAVVTIKRNHTLVRSGPYSITRHPIYTGFLFGLTGSAIVLGELRGFIAIVLLFISVQMKIATEEKFMKERFAEYDDYSRHTRKLIPFLY